MTRILEKRVKIPASQDARIVSPQQGALMNFFCFLQRSITELQKHLFFLSAKRCTVIAGVVYQLKSRRRIDGEKRL